MANWRRPCCIWQIMCFETGQHSPVCVSHSVVSDFFDSMGCSLPISSVHGILQSRIWSKRKESEVTQSCPTLCDPMDCRLPGISVHGIFQARILQWVAISFSRRCSRIRDWTPESPALAGRFFTTEPTRKPNPSTNTGPKEWLRLERTKKSGLQKHAHGNRKACHSYPGSREKKRENIPIPEQIR